MNNFSEVRDRNHFFHNWKLKSTSATCSTRILELKPALRDTITAEKLCFIYFYNSSSPERIGINPRRPYRIRPWLPPTSSTHKRSKISVVVAASSIFSPASPPLARRVAMFSSPSRALQFAHLRKERTG